MALGMVWLPLIPSSYELIVLQLFFYKDGFGLK